MLTRQMHRTDWLRWFHVSHSGRKDSDLLASNQAGRAFLTTGSGLASKFFIGWAWFTSVAKFWSRLLDRQKQAKCLEPSQLGPDLPEDPPDLSPHLKQLLEAMTKLRGPKSGGLWCWPTETEFWESSWTG